MVAAGEGGAAPAHSLRVQDKGRSKVSSFSCSQCHHILAGYEECPVFKVAALQDEVDARGEHVDRLQSDIEEKDAEIRALRSVLRGREAAVDLLQWEATYAREELETRLELVRVACLGPVAAVMDAALEASRTRLPRMPLFGSQAHGAGGAIPMPDRPERARCNRSRSRSGAAPPSPEYSPLVRAAAP